MDKDFNGEHLEGVSSCLKGPGKKEREWRDDYEKNGTTSPSHSLKKNKAIWQSTKKKTRHFDSPEKNFISWVLVIAEEKLLVMYVWLGGI